MKSIYDNPEKMLTKDSYPAYTMQDGMCCYDYQPCLVASDVASNPLGTLYIPSQKGGYVQEEGNDSYYINVWEEKLDFDRIVLENKDCFAVILNDIKGYYGLMIDKKQQRWDDNYYTVCRSVVMEDQALVFKEPQENNKFWFFSLNGRIHWTSFYALHIKIMMVKEDMVPSKRSDLVVHRILK